MNDKMLKRVTKYENMLLLVRCFPYHVFYPFSAKRLSWRISFCQNLDGYNEIKSFSFILSCYIMLFFFELLLFVHSSFFLRLFHHICIGFSKNKRRPFCYLMPFLIGSESGFFALLFIHFSSLLWLYFCLEGFFSPLMYMCLSYLIPRSNFPFLVAADSKIFCAILYIRLPDRWKMMGLIFSVLFFVVYGVLI